MSKVDVFRTLHQRRLPDDPLVLPGPWDAVSARVFEKAKAEGAYKGRKPTVRARSEEIKALADQGMSMGAIAAKLGIGKGSVHRALNPAATAA